MGRSDKGVSRRISDRECQYGINYLVNSLKKGVSEHYRK